ncbi:hypothetical protein EJ04DRAFT_580098 [Polyplosphaeria fusca]|uniref:Heterokaryon incompatibility domain-containing protein n=1 Tax=Polyplosphaeria fusca TaxID=682080 RepID=A0A9P4UX94_9PLEO|nr:hypothetical protein EJ04DRAFT_580098 [Polyplosphaeria fusca]
MPPYQYQPLEGGEIRLMKLLPATDESDDINIVLFSTSLHASSVAGSANASAESDNASEISNCELKGEQNPNLGDLVGSHNAQSPKAIPADTSEPGGPHLENTRLEDLKLEDGPEATQPEQDLNFVPNSPKRTSTWEQILQQEGKEDNARMRSFGFEALSYAWGSEKILVEITVVEDDMEKRKPSGTLLITQDLASALKHLRKSEARVLWVDAICIHQDNLQEKAVYVAKMGEIYETAPRVLVWLGDETEHTSTAFEYLAFLAGETTYNWNNSSLEPSPQAIDPSLSDVNVMLPMSTAQTQAQEIKLAKSAVVVVGQQELDWNLLCGGIAVLYSKTKSFSDFSIFAAYDRPWAQLQHVFQLCLTPARGSNDDHLLENARNCFCKDERDKVFGVLSLVSMFLEWVRPNYEITPSEVYTDLAIKALQHSGSLWLMSHAQLSTARNDAPSWVPNLAVPSSTRALRAFSRCSGFTAAFHEILENNVLRLHGVLADEVASSHAMRVLPVGDLWPDRLSALADLLEVLQDATVKDNSQPFSVDIISKTLVLSRYRDLMVKAPIPIFPYLVQIQELVQLAISRPSDVIDPGQRMEQAWNFVDQGIAAREVFRTTNGTLGVGPPGIEPGDKVCVLMGGKNPFLLRPCDDGKHYKAVGDCYAHGFMNGEALLGPLPNDWESVCVVDSKNKATMDGKHNIKTGKLELYSDPRIPDPEEGTFQDIEGWGRTYPNNGLPNGIFSDPRLTPDFFRERGIDVVDFDLV